MSDHLFTLPSDSFAVTSDDCYTPRWVFDAMGLTFDLDVAAPPGGPWHVPATAYYTREDDGLIQPWTGLVWCNPPYSGFSPWADRFAAHDRVALMGFIQSEVKWGPVVFTAADAVALISCDFSRPDGQKYRWRHQVFVAFRGVGVEPAERLAAADPVRRCPVREACRMKALWAWLLDRLRGVRCRMPGCRYRTRDPRDFIDHLWDHAGEVEL